MGCYDLVKDYCENSTIHGIRYLTEKKRHWIERIFWLGAVCTSAYGMYVLALASWIAFQTHAVSFVTDTTYLRWNTTFPAVSVCETNPVDAIIQYIKRHGLNSRKSYMYLRDMLDAPDNCQPCVTCTKYCPNNYAEIVSEVFKSCEDMFDRCSWNGEEFPCCDNFLPLLTEVGPCFTINSQVNRPQDRSKLIKMISNYTTGPGTLVFHVNVGAEMYLHARGEVPYRNHPSDDKVLVRDLGFSVEHRFKVKEIKNDPRLRNLEIQPRGCRFGEEVLPDSAHKYYSYSSCVVECRMKATIELCNCSHFYQPSKKDVPGCDVSGLACIYGQHRLLGTVRRPWENITGIVCNNCTLPCSDLEINLVWTKTSPNEVSNKINEFRIIMDSLPNERYQRNVIRTKLDLVVSLGGTAGLFLGVSILSGVELLIYIFLRSLPSRKQPQQQQQPTMSAVTQRRANHPSLNRRLFNWKELNNAPQPRRQVHFNVEGLH